MSRKPSIFSKNYQKKIRRRRMRYMTLIIAAILICGVSIAVLFNRGDFQSLKGILMKNTSNAEADEVDDPNSENNNQGEEPGAEENEKDVIVENPAESYEAVLDSGKKVKITYKVMDNHRKIQVVDSDLNVKSYISPSQNSVLMLDEEVQDIFILNEENKLTKITNPQYVSTDKQVFSKESVLSYTPNYRWIDGASFIDDTHVAYSSALPWINEGENLYLWIVDLGTGIHQGYYNVKGREFIFKETTESGLNIEVDGKNITINNQGIVVQ